MPPKLRTIGDRVRRHSQLLAIDPIERQMGGRAGGILYTVAGLSAASYPLLPGAIHGHTRWLYLIAVLSVVWGLVTLFCIDWARMHPAVTHLSTLSAFTGIAVAVASSGGSRSFAWVYLFWVGLFGCYFYSRPVAIFYVCACIFTQALPLLYDHGAVRDGFLSQLIIAGAGYVTVGFCVSTGKRMVDGLRLRAETLAAEQSALQRAASAVIRGDETDRIFALVCANLAELLGSAMVNVSRFDSAHSATVLGSWSDTSERGFACGETLNFDPSGGFARLLATGSVVRDNRLPEASVARSRGCSSTLIAPITIDDVTWGALSLASPDRHAFSRADEQRLPAFAEMLARIVTSLDERARLETEALTDQLTGLPNHRAVHQ